MSGRKDGLPDDICSGHQDIHVRGQGCGRIIITELSPAKEKSPVVEFPQDKGKDVCGLVEEALEAFRCGDKPNIPVEVSGDSAEGYRLRFRAQEKTEVGVVLDGWTVVHERENAVMVTLKLSPEHPQPQQYPHIPPSPEQSLPPVEHPATSEHPAEPTPPQPAPTPQQMDRPCMCQPISPHCHDHHYQCYDYHCAPHYDLHYGPHYDQFCVPHHHDRPYPPRCACQGPPPDYPCGACCDPNYPPRCDPNCPPRQRHNGHKQGRHPRRRSRRRRDPKTHGPTQAARPSEGTQPGGQGRTDVGTQTEGDETQRRGHNETQPVMQKGTHVDTQAEEQRNIKPKPHHRAQR